MVNFSLRTIMSLNIREIPCERPFRSVTQTVLGYLFGRLVTSAVHEVGHVLAWEALTSQGEATIRITGFGTDSTVEYDENYRNELSTLGSLVGGEESVLFLRNIAGSAFQSIVLIGLLKVARSGEYGKPIAWLVFGEGISMLAYSILSPILGCPGGIEANDFCMILYGQEDAGTRFFSYLISLIPIFLVFCSIIKNLTYVPLKPILPTTIPEQSKVEHQD